MRLLEAQTTAKSQYFRITTEYGRIGFELISTFEYGYFRKLF